MGNAPGTEHRDPAQGGLKGVLKINFIADALTEQKHKRIRQRLIIVYVAAWVLALFAMALDYRKYQVMKEVYVGHIEDFTRRIEDLSSPLTKALALDKKRMKHKRQIEKVLSSAIQSADLLHSLAGVARVLPGNAWVEEIEMTALTDLVGDKNPSPKQRMPANFHMRLRCNLFLDLNERGATQFQDLQRELQASQPFVQAKAVVDYENMKVGKMNDRYYHNFEMEFFWPEHLRASKL